MADPIQQQTAASLKTRLAQTRTRIERRNRSANNPKPKLAQTPLSTAEAELFQRLQSALANPPRRKARDDEREAANQHTVWDADNFGPTTLIHAPEPELLTDGALTPPQQLPEYSEEPTSLAKKPLRAILWKHRSRRARLRSALRNSAAWLVTLIVVVATIATAIVLVTGVEKSAQLAALGQYHAQQAATTVWSQIGPMLRK